MNRNCRRKTEKVYVKVTSDFDATGYMQPRQITWGDGRTYPIEQVRDFRPANTIADMPGDCYTVMVFAGRKSRTCSMGYVRPSPHVICRGCI